MAIQVVILAAGQGKRMQSTLPKVLHLLAGKPLLTHVVETALKLSDLPPMVVYGEQGEQLQSKLASFPITWVHQPEPRGTGHALLQTLEFLKEDHRILILYADGPLVSKDLLQTFISKTAVNELGIITVFLDNPHGYGRIIRDAENKVTCIVEEKDATPEEKTIKEINSGIYLVSAEKLKHWLPMLTSHNQQGEYYLTDIASFAVQEKYAINTTTPQYAEEVLGINDRIQLSQMERFYQQKIAKNLMRQGVTLIDPNRFDLRGELIAGRDVTIDINVICEGKVVLGHHCHIGANTILRNVDLGERVIIKANSIIEEAKIGDDCVIGPFARIRPGTELQKKVHIGNFVEIKNSQINEQTKINHLSYIGDSEIGKHVNVGAGTITCNYDGVKKSKTTIHDHAFIGSDTQLVAPVTIGEGAIIGAGSTVTQDAPAHQLTVTTKLEQRSWLKKN